MEVNYFTILYWFCHTSIWIRHRYTHVPYPEPPPSTLPIPSLWVVPVHQPQASSIMHRFLIHGNLQARILEWVAILISRRSSWPREWIQVSCLAGKFFIIWATMLIQSLWEVQCWPHLMFQHHLITFSPSLTTVSHIYVQSLLAASAAAKSLQSCLTLCDPRDSSPPGSPIPGILQARTLVAISFSNAWKWKEKVKRESEVVQSCLTP